MIEGLNESNYEGKDVVGESKYVEEKIYHLPTVIPSAKGSTYVNHYLGVLKKEVDFHHKIAYRFEKAYRLGKKIT